ncbi:putative disease resistance protein RGA4 [Tasmannia lanceolata]|uniref:putative disease resistance protein RGA4 n=1 Tax=Tasmannia lanceolata TaxID=3420 RepID=UPI0040648FE5
MVDAILSVVLEKAFSSILEEFGLLSSVNQELKKLSRTLMTIQDVLNDAEERQVKEAAVRNWLRDLKDLAYDADDILDELATKARQREVEDGNQTVHNLLTCFTSNPIFYRRKIARKIKEIRERLDEISKERDCLRLNEGNEYGQIEIMDRPQTSSLIDKSSVFGREEDMQKIIELLLSDESRGKNVSVVTIVGMGGLGKTTLAQLAYNDEQVKNHFELTIWVSMSVNFDVRRTTKAIIESATRTTSNLNDLDPLQATLQEILHRKRFLIVLDDLWNENHNDWDVLRVPFNVGATGSKIIVTTRSVKVSLVVGTVHTLCLEGLSDNDCWLLFKRRAFVDGSSDGRDNLEIIGREIVKKCRGLPLAAKTLGSLLYSKLDENVWETILKSELWDLATENNGILPALRLSYCHLPAHLKQCFVYCSIFPQDYNFEKEKLVQLWMAEGFIQPSRGKQMEDIGGEYFDGLLWRSFFQYSYSNWEDKPIYKMHDLIHDLAQSISAYECFRMENDNLCSISDKTRHSSLLCDCNKPVFFEAFYKAKSLRTFLFLGVYLYLPSSIHPLVSVPHDMFLKLRCLRVLDLSHTFIMELPKSIGNLKHLRYLDISQARIKKFPGSICRLHNLQTLKLRNCSELLELPKDMSNLLNLRHLDMHTQLINSSPKLRSMPPRIGTLTSLQTLSVFVVNKESECGIGELRNMMNLKGSICISKLENVGSKEEARDAELKNKKHLRELKLQWSLDYPNNLQDEIVEDVLEGLQPHINLKMICICQYGGLKFASWMGCPSSNLETMYILNCRKCKFLPPLGQLPLLKELYIRGIHGVKQVGCEFYGKGIKQFPSLEILALQDMPAVEEWSGIFHCLQELELIDCPKLRELPNLPPTLRNLSIRNCKRLTVLPRLPSLEDLEINGCEEEILRTVNYLTSLTSLSISGFPKLKELPGGFLQSKAKLEQLYIADFDELVSLPKEFEMQDLINLKRLVLFHCPQLASLPQEGLPNTLQNLHIVNCPLLEERCKGGGEDQHKIAHIPNVEMDGQ